MEPIWSQVKQFGCGCRRADRMRSPVPVGLTDPMQDRCPAVRKSLRPPTAVVPAPGPCAAAGPLAEVIQNLPHGTCLVDPLRVRLPRGVPASGPKPVTTLTTPAGKPACSMIFMSSSSDADVYSDGFSTTVLPAASAGASFHAVSSSGEFQGIIAPITPSGSKRV